MIKIKSLDPNKIKIDKNSYKNTLIYHTGYKTVKKFSYITTNSVNPLYLIITKINGCIEESNGNKYLMLVPTVESKDALQRYEELWKKIRDLIRSITKSSDNYHQIYMKIKFNPDDDSPLKKTLELHNILIFRSID